MKIIISENSLIKNILSAIIIAILGFILLNLTFFLDFIFQSILRRLAMIFIGQNPEMNLHWFPFVMHLLFMVFILFISLIIFRTKIKTFFKAVFLVVPIATVLATIGIFFYQWPIIVYVLGFLFILGIIYYFYKTKQLWLYYYSVILVSLVLAIFTALGGEI